MNKPFLACSYMEQSGKTRYAYFLDVSGRMDWVKRTGDQSLLRAALRVTHLQAAVRKALVRKLASLEAH